MNDKPVGHQFSVEEKRGGNEISVVILYGVGGFFFCATVVLVITLRLAPLKGQRDNKPEKPDTET